MKASQKNQKDRYDTVTLDKLDSYKNRNKSSNQVVFIIYVFIILFFALFAYLIYFQSVNGEKYASDHRNPKLIEKEKNIKLGNIYASDGNTVLATSQKVDEEYRRIYPQGEYFAHPIGYSKNGRTELESTLYEKLLTTGDEKLSLLEKIKNIGEVDPKDSGNSVITTLDVGLQKTAYDALGQRRGAVVIMNPKTGKVIAMVSKPSFNPNDLEINWDSLISDEDRSPLLNRATQGLYPPGSTFKVLTALEYMRENSDFMDYRYDCKGVIEKYGLSVYCAFDRAHGEIGIYDALAQSCNGAFIDMGTSLNISKYRNLIQSFGFNNDIPIKNIPYVKSKFTLEPNSSNGEIMQTVFGQGNTLVTPLQNCLIASTIANGGKMMEVQFVDKVINKDGEVIEEEEPKVYNRIIEQSESLELTKMMKYVVTNGIASALNNSNYSVACKTGTAQYNGGNNTHNLIIGFAPVEDPQIAFSVLLEGYEGQPEVDYDLMNVTKTLLDTYFYR